MRKLDGWEIVLQQRNALAVAREAIIQAAQEWRREKNPTYSTGWLNNLMNAVDALERLERGE